MKQVAADNEADLVKASNVLKPTSKAYVTKRVTDVKTPYPHTTSFPAVVLVSGFKTRR